MRGVSMKRPELVARGAVRYKAQKHVSERAHAFPASSRAEPMRVFVTGGTGFVGSHVVEGLVEQGHEPLCLVRETSDTEHLDEIGAEQFVGSLSDVEGLAPAIEQADAIIHIAGVIKVRRPRDFYSINGEATCRLAELTSELNPDLGRFVYLSSMSAMGPCFAPEWGTEEDNPVSHYGRSKLLGEQGVRAVSDRIPTTIFRPPPVYGPRDWEMFKVFKGAKWGVMPVYGDGSSKLSVVHVFDLVDAIRLSLEKEHESGAIFPIDDGSAYTWEEMATIAGKPFGKSPKALCIPSPLFEVGARASELWGKMTNRAMIFTRDKLAEMKQEHWVCGNAALKEKLGWEPKWPFERGAEQTAKWYLENGWL